MKTVVLANVVTVHINSQHRQLLNLLNIKNLLNFKRPEHHEEPTFFIRWSQHERRKKSQRSREKLCRWNVL